MPGRSSTRTALSLPREARWTLHHALLERLEEGGKPPAELHRAFERVDSGEALFTPAELECIRDVLADYHHATGWWEIERASLEDLLYRITEALEATRTGRTR